MRNVIFATLAVLAVVLGSLTFVASANAAADERPTANTDASRWSLGPA